MGQECNEVIMCFIKFQKSMLMDILYDKTCFIYFFFNFF